MSQPYRIKIGDNELQFASAKQAVEELKEAVVVARLDADDEEEANKDAE